MLRLRLMVACLAAGGSWSTCSATMAASSGKTVKSCWQHPVQPIWHCINAAYAVCVRANASSALAARVRQLFRSCSRCGPGEFNAMTATVVSGNGPGKRAVPCVLARRATCGRKSA